MQVGRAAALQSGDVHVWRARLDVDAGMVERCHALLSADERERAGRFLLPPHRAAYTVGRARLRTLLGRYLDADPAALRFVYSRHGKPALDAQHGHRLRFNLAHSHGLAVYAVTVDRAVGVDVERIRPEIAAEAIAEQHFSANERSALRRLNGEQRARAFFHAWTRKEAFLKGLGTGLALPLDDFDVSLTPDAPAALLDVRGAAATWGAWSLHELEMPIEYVGALAVDGEGCRVWCGDWPEE